MVRETAENMRPAARQGVAEHQAARTASFHSPILLQAVLETLADGAALGATLESLCAWIEGCLPGTHGCVLLPSDAANWALTAGLGLPAELKTSLTLPRGGNLAEACRGVAESYGFRGFWCAPIADRDGGDHGLVLALAEKAEAPPHIQETLGTAGRLAGIAMRRARSETELRESQAQLGSIFTALAEGVVFIDSDGVLGACNASAERILGLSRDEIVDVSLRDPKWRTIHEEGTPFLTNDYPAIRSLRTGEACRNVVMGVHKPDGALTWITINTQPLFRDGQSGPYAVVASFADITSRKAAEQEALQRQADLAHVQRRFTADEMATSIAHELNQPLAAIMNHAEAGKLALKRGGADGSAGAAASLDAICQQTERIVEVIRRLRKLVRKQAPNRAAVDLNTVVRSALRLVETDARERGVTVRLALAEQPAAAFGDAVLLEQVLLNLMRNAIEAMAQSTDGRELSLRTQGDEGWLRVEVGDTGPGAAGDAFDKLFEAYYTTKPGGLGMGLAISRTIVESHGGRLWAQRNPQRGLTFVVRLPMDSR